MSSWQMLQNKLTEAKNILNENQNHTSIENQATQETINNVTASLEILKNNLKHKAPSKPTIEVNNQIPNMAISPDSKANKLNITYQNSVNEQMTIIANKSNDTWSLNNNITGITIEPQSGLVTINYQVVYPESVIEANDSTDNSDTSEVSSEKMPRKEVTPNDESTKLVVKYTGIDDQLTSIIASKNGTTWTLNNQVSHITLDEKTGKMTIGYQAVQAGSEIVATETKGNSDASSAAKINMPKKEPTPESPKLEANDIDASVSITPNGESTNVIIKYLDLNDEISTIIASKNSLEWTLNKNVFGININSQTGKVTISYIAVQPESDIIATETKGNSDPSSESKANMPRKEPTPEAPIVNASEVNASVYITPKGGATKLEVHYTDEEGKTSSLTASNKSRIWSLNKEISGITIDSQTGQVTISYQAVQPESEIVATETKGNSDPSSESKANMPRKEPTPVGPILESNQNNASVSISPNEGSTKVFIKYLDSNDQINTILASKLDQKWSLNKDLFGISIDSFTGKVTISYVAVQPESEISATEVKGNSDESPKRLIEMPVKEVTPPAPIIEADDSNPSVNILPNDESTKLEVFFTDPQGQPQTLTISKIGNKWIKNKEVSHITLNTETGRLTIGYLAVQSESEIIAVQYNGNSDASHVSQKMMPRKESTPEAPLVKANEVNASVNIIPKGRATNLEVHYMDEEGKTSTITAIKNDDIWSLSKLISGITIDSQTGQVTISYQAVQPESEIVATETKGNSDKSNEAKVKMPRKETTPAPPILKANKSEATVSILPNGNATKIIIKYLNLKKQMSTILAIKSNQEWSLDKEIIGATIDRQTGEVTMNYVAIQPSSEIIAKEVYGNSDESVESKINMPLKEATPKSPLVEANLAKATVSISPHKYSTKLEIHYFNTNGQLSSIIATKEESVWKLNKDVAGIMINSQSGKVTIAYKAVQAESEIIATESKGNSDSSLASKIIMPRKEMTPQPPYLNSDMKQGIVIIKPNSDSTKLEIKYMNKLGQLTTISANKINQEWCLNQSREGIKINPVTGEVIISEKAVFKESMIFVKAYKDNSDGSKEVSIQMPIKLIKIEQSVWDFKANNIINNKNDNCIVDTTEVKNEKINLNSKEALPKTGEIDNTHNIILLGILTLGLALIRNSSKKRE